MHENEFVAFDLETTGLSPTFDRIVEVGAVRFRADGTELDRLEQLVDPCCRIPTGAVRVHGITDSMVRGKPTIEEVLPEFLRFVGNSDTILLAHNASFDLGFISAALNRSVAVVPKNRVVDTLGLSRRRMPGLRRHGLAVVAQHFRIVSSTKHRALADALVVESLFLKLLAQPPVIRTLEDVFRCVSPLCFQASSPESDPAGCEDLIEAIRHRHCITIVYAGGTKGRSTRQITPKRLTESQGTLYLIARCHIDDMDKHFRVDRIVGIEST